MIKKYRVKIIICTLFLLITSILSARDVNLDKIYIKKSSNSLYKLLDAKLEMFKTIGASLIDQNIIFAGWTSGSRIIYLKEYLSSNQNTLYEYFPQSRIKKELFKIRGAVIFGRVSSNGRYFFLKRLIQNNTLIPESEILIIDLRTKEKHHLKSNNVFLDFTISYRGDALIYEEPAGITEYYPATKRKRLILAKYQYAGLQKGSNPILAFQSPNKQKLVLISGGGGEYSALYYENGIREKEIKSISSASEIFWIDNSNLVFRKGYTGYYQVAIYNLNSGETKIISKNSFNTNIIYSPRNKIVTFVEDGGVAFYNSASESTEKYPIEGEDLNFSPRGNQFCILYDKKLLLARQHTLNKKSLALKRISTKILDEYKRLAKADKSWNNEYTLEYINRKIRLYKRYLK